MTTPHPTSAALRPARRARLRAVTAAALAVLVVVAGCAEQVRGEAVAGRRSPLLGPPISSESVSLRHDYEESPQEVNDYWTTDRRSNARPKDVDSGTDAGSVPDRATGVVVEPSTGRVASPVPVAPSTAGDRFVATGLAASTQGRLYISVNGTDWVCSATVVASQVGTIVATAAHCLLDFEDGTGWATKVMFVPADEDDASVAPYGRWTAESVYGPAVFAEQARTDALGQVTGGGWSHDFAFLTMNRDDQGRTIEEVTGGQGISFGTTVDDLVVVGYPSAAPFDGRSQRYCASDGWFPSPNATYAITCDMNQGASGGAWLSDYDVTSGSGYVVATSSYRTLTDVAAPPFGEDALALYTEAGGL